MRAEGCRAPLEVARERGVQRLASRRLAFVANRRVRQAELGGACGKRRRDRLDRLDPVADELGAELRNTLRPRLDRVRAGVAAGSSPQRGVSLRYGASVLRGKSCARRKKPAEDTVEVRAPRRGWAFDDAEAIRGEDEGRHPG